jgi:glutamate transport system permease protein
LFVFGLPDIGFTYSLFTSTAVCLALAAAAFVCEAMRAGINTVPVGQAEAARALGLPFAKVLRFVILPQAFRAMVQPLINVFIGVELSSSLAAAVGVAELTNRTEQLNLHYAQAVAGFLVAGAMYIALALTAGGTGGWLERRMTVRR